MSKHWRGEYSLPRSFWVHGVLLGYLLLALSSVLTESRLYPGSPFFSIISMIGIGIWQIGGVWRSAKRQGGSWAKTANFSIVLVLLGFISNFTVKHELERLKINNHFASSRFPDSPPINPAAYTQPWKQVGEWEIRYDSLGDGTSSGCFMVRAYRNLSLRIGVNGDNYYVLFTSENLKSGIEDRKQYILSLRFGELTPWAIKAEPKIFASGIKSLVFHTNDQRFFGELVSSNSLTISQLGTPIFEFTVTGSKEALAAMLACQESHKQNPLKSS